MEIAQITLKLLLGLLGVGLLMVTVSVFFDDDGWAGLGVLPLLLACAVSFIWAFVTPLPLSLGVGAEIGLRVIIGVATALGIFFLPFKFYEPAVRALFQRFGWSDSARDTQSSTHGTAPWKTDEEARELAENYRTLVKHIITKRSEGSDPSTLPPHTTMAGGTIHFRREHRERIPELPLDEDDYRAAFYFGIDMMYENGEDPRIKSKRKYYPLEEFRANYLSFKGKYRAYPGYIRIGNWLFPKFWSEDYRQQYADEGAQSEGEVDADT